MKAMPATRGFAAMVIVMSLGHRSLARATEGEIELGLSPALTVADVQGDVRTGAGAALTARYDIAPTDWLVLDVTLCWDRTKALEQSIGSRGQRFYDAERLGLNTSLLLRVGYPFAWVIGPGLGYRFERETNERAVGAARTEERHGSTHRLVAVVTTAFEWRFTDRLTSAVWLRADLPSRAGSFDGAAGLLLSVVFWP